MSSTVGVVGEELDRKAKQILAEKGKTFDEVTPDEYERAVVLAEEEALDYDVRQRARAFGVIAATTPDTQQPYPIPTDDPPISDGLLNPPKYHPDVGLHLRAMEILREAGIQRPDDDAYQEAIEQAKRDTNWKSNSGNLGRWPTRR